ncbi:MAG: Bug family tripartite tricarboxylate transporter substrate binding protein [Rubrivivax sp.]
MTDRRQILAQGLGLLAATAVPAASRAQAWPTQPVKLIVTFPPGGSSDIVARLVAPLLSQRIGQTVTVENRPGAASTLGAALVARSQPDGHTLLMSNSAPMSISPTLMDKPSYDPLASFRHLAYIGDVPTVLVVHPSVPVTDFAGFVAWAKAQGEPVSFGSGGQASVGHIVGELLAQQAGLKMQHVPYKGAGPMRSDLLGGQIKVAVDALPQNIPFLTSGRLRLLAVTAPQRVAQAPDVPSVVELGYPGLVAQNFVGISAPAGLPSAVEQRLVSALTQVLADADLQAKLRSQGFELATRTPEGFADFIRQQAERWAPVVKASGAKL